METQDSEAVAVCIPTYNQSEYLEISVLSACRQSYPNIEIWVADDASTDETPQVMARLCTQYPMVRYHRQSVNMGIAENTSWLLSQPQTDFIVRLDSDDILEPEYTVTLLEEMQKHPEAGYGHTAIQQIDSTGAKKKLLRVARPTGYLGPEQALRDSVTGYRTAANIVMFRAKAVRDLNYYRERPTFVEDYDLSVRLADAGYGNVYIDDALARYRVWTDTGKARVKRKHLQLRGYTRIFEESLQPAFERRHWSLAPIERQRRWLAKRNLAYCFSPDFSPAEREELVGLLIRLGDSRSLRVRILLARMGLGFVFESQYWFIAQLKAIAKALISKARRRQAHAA